jgi:hypothetical protein
MHKDEEAATQLIKNMSLVVNTELVRMQHFPGRHVIRVKNPTAQGARPKTQHAISVCMQF